MKELEDNHEERVQAHLDEKKREVCKFPLAFTNHRK